MGVLDVAGNRQSGDAPDEQVTDAVAVEAPESTETQTTDRPRAEDGTFVPHSALKPQAQGSRRNKTQEQIDAALDARMKAYEERQTQERQSWQQQLQEERAERQRLAQEHARLTGVVETYQRMPQQTAPQGPDPGELRRKAREALAAGNVDEYDRLRDQAADIVAERKAEEKVRAAREEWQKTQAQQPQPMPMHIQQLLMAHPNVAAAGQRGIEAVMVKDKELEIYGHAAGPDRQRKAFELANQMLAARQTGRPAGFSQDAAAALSGVPTGNRSASGGAGGSEAGVRLTGDALEVQRRSGMSPEEYVKWSNPGKYGLA